MCEGSGDDFRVSHTSAQLATSVLLFHSRQVRFFAGRLYRSLFGDARSTTTNFNFKFYSECARFTHLQSRHMGGNTASHFIRVPLRQ
jgi:hypothetical protein